MLAILFYLGLIITQCVWTSVSETGAMSIMLFHLVMMVKKCVRTDWYDKTSFTRISALQYQPY